MTIRFPALAFVLFTTACASSTATDPTASRTSKEIGGDGQPQDATFTSDADGYQVRYRSVDDGDTITITHGGDTATFSFDAASATVTPVSSSLDAEGTKALVRGAADAFDAPAPEAAPTGSDLQTTSLHPLGINDLCGSEWASWDNARVWVNGSALGGLVGFLLDEPVGPFISWTTARQAMNQAAQALGQCCWQRDPNFTSPNCSDIWWHYAPLTVPGGP